MKSERNGKLSILPFLPQQKTNFQIVKILKLAIFNINLYGQIQFCYKLN